MVLLSSPLVSNPAYPSRWVSDASRCSYNELSHQRNKKPQQITRSWVRKIYTAIKLTLQYLRLALIFPAAKTEADIKNPGHFSVEKGKRQRIWSLAYWLLLRMEAWSYMWDSAVWDRSTR